MAPLMAGQMPVVVVSGGWRRCRLAQKGDGLPPPSTTSPPFPLLIFRQCRSGVYSATRTAHVSFLFCSLPSRYCHLVPSGHGGLCASSALGLAKPLLQPSRSISSAHFLLLKAVVLAVADGRRPGRRAAAFPAWLMGIPSDARSTCFHHIERAVR